MITFLNEQSVNQVHLVGISFGGMIAQKIALKNSVDIKSLTLIATACTFDEPVRQILKDRARFVVENGMAKLAPITLGRWFTDNFAKKRPEMIDRVKKLLLLQDATYHAPIWGIVSTLDMQGRLRSLEMLAMILVGDKDSSTPIDSARTMADALKTGNIHIIDNAAHFPTLEAADEVNNLLLNFFLSFGEKR